MVKHTWINFDGCDGLYSVAADNKLVFVGGHNRWFDNPHQCNNNNSGKARPAQGIAGLTVAHGALGIDWQQRVIGGGVGSDCFSGVAACGRARVPGAPGDDS